MEYAMRIIIPVGEQIFCSWLFHALKLEGFTFINITNHHFEEEILKKIKSKLRSTCCYNAPLYVLF